MNVNSLQQNSLYDIQCPTNDDHVNVHGEPTNIRRSITLDIRDAYHHMETTKCPAGKVFDENVAKCVTYACRKESVKVDENFKCVPVQSHPYKRKYMDKPNVLKCFDVQPHLASLVFHHKPQKYLAKLLSVIIYELTGDCVVFDENNHHFAVVKTGKLSPLSSGDIIKMVENGIVRNYIFNVIDKLTVSSIGPFLATEVLYDNFPGDKICAEKVESDVGEVKFTNSCSAVVEHGGGVIDDILIQKTIDHENSTLNVYRCKRYYITSDCLLRQLNASNSVIDKEKHLHFKEVNGKVLVYPVEEYTPLQNGDFGVCVRRKVGEKKQPELSAGESYVSFIGICISPWCYILLLYTFIAYEEHFPGYGLVSLCSCLLLQDILFLSAVIIDVNEIQISFIGCKLLANFSHLAFLLVQVCVVVLGIDNAITFRKLSIHVNETAKVYYRTRCVVLVVPLVIVCLPNLLDEYTSREELHAKTCLMHTFEVRLIFYMLPAIISFLTGVSLMSFTLYKLRQQSEPTRDSPEESNIRPASIRFVALKLILAYGLAEFVGFVQIPGPLSHSEHIVNQTFAFVYTCVSSFRGVALLRWPTTVTANLL